MKNYHGCCDTFGSRHAPNCDESPSALARDDRDEDTASELAEEVQLTFT